MTYLSYSGYSTEEKCGLQYWHKYVNKTLVEPENGINALYGSTVGVLFENFYKDKLWKDSDVVKTMTNLAKPTLDKVMKETTQKGRILDWGDPKSNYKSPKAILEDVEKAIPTGIQNIRRHRLMGPFMEAEMKLDVKFGRHTMGGRADFVIRRASPLRDLVIVDGKGSKHRAKYLDGGKPKKDGDRIEGIQLKWYAVLYRELYGVAPDKLAYLFWRFEGEESIEWVPFKESDLDDLKAEVLYKLDRIEKTTKEIDRATHPKQKEELREEYFPAKSGFHCNMCPYVNVCEAGKKVVSRSNRTKSSIPEGVEELSLGVDDV